MAITTLKLWMAPESNRLLSGPSSFSPAQNPVFYEGNTARIELHILAGAGVGKVPYEVAFPAGASIKLAVGQVNAFPTSGTWQLMVDDVETADMPFNATPAQVQAALNALATVQAAGGVTSALNGDGYTVTWNTYGTKPDIGIGSDTLVPSSYESISLVQQGTADNRKVIYIELRQAPVALGVEWDPLPTPVMTVEEVTAWNGTTKTWRFNIEPAPKAGSYNLTVAGASTKSYTLSYASTADNITTAISKDFAGAKAYKTGETQFDIVFNEDVTLTADGNGLIGYLGFIGNVNFSTAEIHQFIGGLASRQTTLEVAIEAGGIPQTLIQVPCVVSSDVISNGVLQPLPLGTAMSEQVANARFVRRDVDQSPDVPTKNQIWENLGLTEHDGHDVVSALSSSNFPSGTNPFVTQSDISALDATWGNIIGTLSDQTDLQLALDDKYDASNPSGFIQEANVDGNLYGRKNGLWEVVPGFNGGVVANPITMAGATKDSEMSSDYFGLQLSADNTQFATLEYNKLNISTTGVNAELNCSDLVFLAPDLGRSSVFSITGATITTNASECEVLPSSITFTQIGTGNSTQVATYGIKFPDASVQTTAATPFDPTGYATESWVTSQGYITGDALVGYATEYWVQSQGYLTSVPPPSLTGLTSDISWDTNANSGRLLIEGVIETAPNFTQSRLHFGTSSPNSLENGDFWFDGNNMRYVSGAVIRDIASQYWVSTSYYPLYSNPAGYITSSALAGYATQAWVTSQSYLTQAGAALFYAPLSGATFTGKVNLATLGVATPSINLGGQCDSAPASAANGDLWISNATAPKLTYKMGGINYNLPVLNQFNTFTNQMVIDTASSTTAALRVTQRGAGNAIEVEDSVSPDANKFVVDQFGKVGVGVAPDATAAIKIDGNGISFNGLVFNPTATAAHTGGSDTLDLLVTINGVNYRLGLRPA